MISTERAADPLRAVIMPLQAALAANSDVRWAYLFGSAVRGEAFRDIDVGVVMRPSARGAVRFGQLIAALESVAPIAKVDVVDLGASAPAMRASAVREGRLLVDREPDARRDWEIEVTRVWLDLEPWLAWGEKLRLEALKQRTARRWP